MRRQALVILTLSVVAGASSAPRSDSVPSERRAVLFYTGAVHGALEPCGCTSDPLGDIARMTGLVRRVHKETGAVLVVDGGNLSYPAQEIPPARRQAASLKAGFLGRELAKLPFAGSALGEADLAKDAGEVTPRRLAANLASQAPFVERSRVHQVGGMKIGVFGLVDPALARARGWTAAEPVAAAREEAERLRREGAEIVVALVPLPRPQARQIARGAPVDFVVLGKETGPGLARAEQVGTAFLVAAADELQKIGRLDIVLRGETRQGLVDGGSPATLQARRAELTRAVAELESALARWEQDKGSDAVFVAAKKRELAELRAERRQLGEGAWTPPAQGAFFTNQLIPMSRALPRDPVLAAAMRRLDAAVGSANLKHATPPPRAEPGRASFVGDKACARCHKPEMAFWKTTVHAQAWKTLVVGGKTGHDDCVSCHVTGYGEVGGSTLGFTKGLETVQCESCHGPASIHVAQEGLEEPPAVRLQAPDSLCVRCHNEKHSDTFQYQAYLRDVLGPGHGEAARAKLGPGPTGRELRRAAVAKAKAAGEALKKRL